MDLDPEIGFLKFQVCKWYDPSFHNQRCQGSIKLTPMASIVKSL